VTGYFKIVSNKIYLEKPRYITSDGFEVLIAVTMKVSNFWDISPFSPVLDPEVGSDMLLRNTS
jgi:hypothetical protein